MIGDERKESLPRKGASRSRAFYAMMEECYTVNKQLRCNGPQASEGVQQG